MKRVQCANSLNFFRCLSSCTLFIGIQTLQEELIYREDMQRKVLFRFVKNLSKLCQFFSFLSCASCTRRISNTVPRHSAKLYTMNAHIVKLCNIKMFFVLSKIFQNYDNFFKFRFLHLRHFTSEFNLTVQEKGMHGAIVQCKVICRFVKKLSKLCQCL